MEQTQEFLDRVYAELSRRKRSQFRIAHTLHDENGYTVCDVDVTAPTLEEAKALLLEKLASLARTDVLPCAPKETWGRFLAAEFKRREIIDSEYGALGLIGIYIREA
jgi:hypothetical protein